MKKLVILLILMFAASLCAVDTEVQDLTVISDVAVGDILYIYDISNSASRYVTMDNLIDPWTGSTTVVTLGTITAGIWNGTAIAAGYLAADVIDETKIADDGIDSEHYNDGSIDLVHLAAGVYAKDIVTTAPMTGATDNVLVGADSDITLALDFTTSWDFGGASSFELPQSAAPATDAAGEIALDTTITDHQPFFQYYDGDENMTIVALPTANLNSTDNYILKYDAASDDWQMEEDSSGTPGTDSIGTDELDDGSDTPADEDIVTYEATGTEFEYHTIDEVLDNTFSSTGLLKRSGAATYSIATVGTDYVTADSTNIFTNKTFSASGAGNSLQNVDEDDCQSGSDLVRSAIEFVIDGGGSAISTGIVGDIEIPFGCTIQRATILADQSGAIKIDIWVDTYANFPPTDADTITGGNEPEIAASGVKDQDITLTSWTKPLTAGSIMRFNVDSISTITRCTISLILEK